MSDPSEDAPVEIEAAPADAAALGLESPEAVVESVAGGAEAVEQALEEAVAAETSEVAAEALAAADAEPAEQPPPAPKADDHTAEEFVAGLVPACGAPGCDEDAVARIPGSTKYHLGLVCHDHLAAENDAQAANRITLDFERL